jgi:hypothetical protein
MICTQKKKMQGKKEKSIGEESEAHGLMSAIATTAP